METVMVSSMRFALSRRLTVTIVTTSAPAVQGWSVVGFDSAVKVTSLGVSPAWMQTRCRSLVQLISLKCLRGIGLHDWLM